jgi:glycosyltransferase involved in cell wall biosynthesis
MTGHTEKQHKMLILGAIDAGQPNACVLHLFSMALAFLKLGHHVEVVIPKPPGGHIAMDLGDSQLTVHQKLSAKSLSLPNSFNNLFWLPWLLFHVKRHQIDIVYSRLNAFSFITNACLRLFTSAQIISEHNGWVEDEVQALKYPKWLAWLERRFQICDARFAHLIRVVVPGIKDLLVHAGISEQKIFVVGNGTNTAHIHPLDRQSVMTQLKLDPSLFYIGFIGHLAAWQGVDLAILAFAQIVSKNPNARLLIAGDGPERHTLEQLTKKLKLTNRVHFLGSIALSRSNLVINAFDIAIAPFTAMRNSRIGLSPLKIRDYAAAGRPVVAADVPGIRESTSSDWLITHTVDQETDLCDKICSLISTPNRLKQMGECARQFAVTRYDWSQIATDTLYEIENRIRIKEKDLVAIS